MQSVSIGLISQQELPFEGKNDYVHVCIDCVRLMLFIFNIS